MLDDSGTADANEWGELPALFLRGGNKPLQHLDDCFHRMFALGTQQLSRCLKPSKKFCP
jgi:hypothetical protein